MSDDREPPLGGTYDCGARPQLATIAVDKGRIRLDIDVPSSHDSDTFAGELSAALNKAVPARSPDEAPPTLVFKRSHYGHPQLTAVYRPQSDRDIAADQEAVIGALSNEYVNVVMTPEVERVIRRTFAQFQEIHTPEHTGAVSAESARRTSRKEPGGRGSR